MTTYRKLTTTDDARGLIREYFLPDYRALTDGGMSSLVERVWRAYGGETALVCNEDDGVDTLHPALDQIRLWIDDAACAVEVELDSAVGPRVMYGDQDCDEVDAALPEGWEAVYEAQVRTDSGRWSTPLRRVGA